MNNTVLKPKGMFWRDLSNAEKEEIRNQITNVEHDPNYVNYKWYRTTFNRWIICNAFAVPMKTNKNIYSKVE
jgi:hypothetical protein